MKMNRTSYKPVTRTLWVAPLLYHLRRLNGDFDKNRLISVKISSQLPNKIVPLSTKKARAQTLRYLHNVNENAIACCVLRCLKTRTKLCTKNITWHLLRNYMRQNKKLAKSILKIYLEQILLLNNALNITVIPGIRHVKIVMTCLHRIYIMF